MASWRPVLQVLFLRIRAISAIMNYAKLKYTAESGGINLGPRKLFLPAFC